MRWPDRETRRRPTRACSSRRCRRSPLLGDGLRLAQGRGAGSRRCRSSSPRSTAWTSTSSTSAREHEGALPLIVTHGWPGSIIEQLKIIGPLTDPDGARRERRGRLRRRDPVAAGSRLLGQADRTGWDPIRIARAWIVLMERLGYTRYVAQGGDWGNAVTEQMALLAPPGLLGIHTNMPATIPSEIAAALASRRARRRPVSRPTSSTRGTSSTSSTSTGWPTPRRWGTARRRSTRSRTRRSGWPPGCSTTTRASHDADRARLRRARPRA